MTFHLRISGRVQGVGFRPHIHKCAVGQNIKGQVSNDADGVHLIFNAASMEAAQAFTEQLIWQAPPKAIIRKTSLQQTDDRSFQDFSIVTRQNHSIADLLISPDFAICADCRKEFHDPVSRRYQYPFITCSTCGPRYSIINELPYERHLTAMHAFTQCPACLNEYKDISNRRYYSQTNSCPQCGVQLSWHSVLSAQVIHHQPDIQHAMTKALQDGKIIAAKGIGGFLLLCDATNKRAIQLLRERKQRPAKPLAVMFPNMEMIQQMTVAGPKETAMLLDDAAPVVLLRATDASFRQLDMKGIAPGLSTIGVMFPYAPLLEWIMSRWRRPLIATSGNLSGSCILFQSTQKKELFRFADHILDHDRDISTPQDDSVVRFTQNTLQPIKIRRSRGYAPSIVIDSISDNTETIFAAGASLKSAFALQHNKQIYVSQFLGNLESYDAQQNYQHTYLHLCHLVKAKPQVILTDLHPDYASTQLAVAMSQAQQLPLKKIQHHEAHFAAILGEHELFNTTQKVLGVIWDGTGLGTDGGTWGGEFMIYSNGMFNRVNHLQPFVNVAGDKMAGEPRLSALSASSQIPEAEGLLRSKFSDKEWDFYQKALHQKSTVTTSAGRYFDAVASLLKLTDFNTYEGEGGLLLEESAQHYFEENNGNMAESYFHEEIAITPINMKEIFHKIIADINSGKESTAISAKFHKTMADIILQVARLQNVDCIACSGGVFQNAVLVDLIALHTDKAWPVYFHEQLPPNDECIAFGQLMHYQHVKTA